MAEREVRRPVKLPGPSPMPKSEISAGVMPWFFSSSSTALNMRSEAPRLTRHKISPISSSFPSSAMDELAVEVSIAKVYFMGELYRN